MPTPRPALFKNATGLLQESVSTCRSSLPSHFRASTVARQNGRQTTEKYPTVHARNLHLSSYAAKQRQVDSTPARSPETPAAPRDDFLADLTASAWSTSPVNTGYPFYNEFPSFNPPPSAEAKEPPALRHPSFDLSAVYWSFSPTNPGAGLIDDSILFVRPHYNFPPRSLEAYDNIMASDEDYTAFLDKAADDAKPTQKAQSKPAQQKTVNTNSVHPALQNVHQHTYTSDADEAFEPVSMTRESGKSGAVSKGDVAGFAGVAEGKVEEVSKKEFDPQGQYEAVWKAVTDASAGGVKAFKVEQSGARCEYWILGVSKDGHVVGAKAKAVES